MGDVTDFNKARQSKEPLLILEDIADAIRESDLPMPDSLLTIYRLESGEIRLAHHCELYDALAMLELAKTYLIAQEGEG